MGGSLRRVFEIATGFSLGNIFESVVSGAVRATRELVKMGLEVTRQEDAFARMTASVGVSGPALASALEEASRGLADASDLMVTASLALEQGFSTSQLVEMMKTATANAKLMGVSASDAFNTLGEAILKGTDRALQASKIYGVDLKGAQEAYAASIGVTVKELTEQQLAHINLQTVLNATAERTRVLNAETLTATEQAARAGVIWTNFWENVGRGVVSVGATIITWFSDVFGWLEKTGRALDDFLRSWGLVSNAEAADPKFLQQFPSSSTTPAPAGPQLGPYIGELKEAQAQGALAAAAAKKVADEAAKISAKKAADEVKDLAAEAEKAAKAMAGFQARVIDAAIADETARSLVGIRREVAALTTAFPQHAAQIAVVGAALEDMAVAARQNADAMKELDESWKRTIDPLSDGAERATLALGAFEVKLTTTGLGEAYRRSLQDVQYGLEGVGTATVDIVDVQDQARESTEEFGESLMHLPLIETDTRISTLTNLLQELKRNGVDPLSEAFDVLGASLRDAISADTADALADASLKAEILGSDFDLMGAKVSIARVEWERSVEAYRVGGITLDELTAAGGRFRAVLADQSLFQGIEGMFLSVTDTFTKMAEGLSQGTLDIGEAFANLGRNLLTNFVQVVLHQVFDPILTAAASFVSDLIGILIGRKVTSGLAAGLIGLIAGGLGGDGGAGNLANDSAGLATAFANDSLSGSGGTVDTLSNLGSALSTLYDVVAYVADLPSSLTLAGNGITYLGEALGLLTPAITELGGGTAVAVAALGDVIAEAFGTAAPVIAEVSSALAGAAPAASTFAGAMGTLGGVLGALAPGVAILGLVLDAAQGDDYRRYINRQRFIQSEGFTQTELETPLAAVEAGGTLTERNAEALSVLGAVAKRVAEFDREQIRREAEQGVSQFGQVSPDVAVEMAEAVTAYIGPFLTRLEAIGIKPFEGEHTFEIITNDFQGLVEAWTNALERFVPKDLAGDERLGDEPLLAADERLGDETLRLAADVETQRMRVEATLTAAAYGQLADALGVARQSVPDFTTMLAVDIPSAIDTMQAGLAQSIEDRAAADPRFIAVLLQQTGALAALAEAGEDVELTLARVGQAFVDLTDFAASLHAEAAEMRDPSTVWEQISTVTEKLVQAKGQMVSAISALNPEEALARAEEARALIIERHDLEIRTITDEIAAVNAATDAIHAQIDAIQAEIDTVNGLVDSIRATASAVATTANTIASNAPFLAQIGVHISSATTSMVAFSRVLPDVSARITVLGGALNLFLAQFRGVTSDIAKAIAAIPQAPPREEPLAGAALDAKIQEILRGPAAEEEAGGMRSAESIIEAEIQGIRESIQRPADVAKAMADIAAVQAKLPELDAFLAEQKALAQPLPEGAPGGPSPADALLALIPNAQDLLAGIQEGFTAAMGLTDAGERATALDDIFSLLGSGVTQIQTLLAQSGLSNKEQTAVMDEVLGAVEPLGTEIYDAMLAAATEQGKAAIAAAAQLKEIMGPEFTSVQNFIAAKTGDIAAKNADIAISADKIAFLNDRIATATEDTADALADLATSITGPLGRAISSMTDAIVAAIPTPTALQGGADWVRGGLYNLHNDELVLNPHAAAMARSMGITNASLERGQVPYAVAGSGSVTVSLQFGEVHVGGGKEGAREFMDTLRDEIRYGDLGAVIARRVTGRT